MNVKDTLVLKKMEPGLLPGLFSGLFKVDKWFSSLGCKPFCYRRK